MEVTEGKDMLEQLVLMVKYRTSSSSRERLFPSDSAVEWYVRAHKSALIECGALLKHRGAWHVHATRFDQAVLSIAEGASKLEAA